MCAHTAWLSHTHLVNSHGGKVMIAGKNPRLCNTLKRSPGSHRAVVDPLPHASPTISDVVTVPTSQPWTAMDAKFSHDSAEMDESMNPVTSLPCFAWYTLAAPASTMRPAQRKGSFSFGNLTSAPSSFWNSPQVVRLDFLCCHAAQSARVKTHNSPEGQSTLPRSWYSNSSAAAPKVHSLAGSSASESWF